MTRHELLESIALEVGRLSHSAMRRYALQSRHAIEGQCAERFGCTFDEIRARIFTDLDSIDRYDKHTDDIILNMSSGYWIVNQLRLLWLLRKRTRDAYLERLSDEAKCARGLERLLDEIESGLWKFSRNTLYCIAPHLLPELAKEVLASHGISIVSNPEHTAIARTRSLPDHAW